MHVCVHLPSHLIALLVIKLPQFEGSATGYYHMETKELNLLGITIEIYVPQLCSPDRSYSNHLQF